MIMIHIENILTKTATHTTLWDICAQSFVTGQVLGNFYAVIEGYDVILTRHNMHSRPHIVLW